MARAANHPPACLLDCLACILLQRPPERIVGGDEIPGIETEADHSACNADRVGISIVGPMEAGVGAILARQIAAAARHCYRNPFARSGKLLDCQRYRRIRHVYDRAHLLVVQPTVRYRRCNVDVVLVVAKNYADFSTEYLSTEILNCHLGC